jgi:uncharacterized repeat protein (TIGR01451 family)
LRFSFFNPKKTMKKTNLKRIITLAGCATLLAGCATHPEYTNTQPTVVTTTSAPVVEPAKPGTVSAYFPSGKADGSGLLVEKSAPAEVLAGQPFNYTYKVSNLTDATLENVTVSDRVTSNFAPTDSDPKAAGNSGGIGTWTLGSLGPKETKIITVKGASADEGVVTTCGWATYTPVACQDIRVVKANIELTKTEPADDLICDVIPVTLAVKNSGSSALTGVQIADTLPDGLTSDSKNSLTFDVGNLAPGEVKEFKYNANASATGKFVNKAKVTSAEGVSAEASATTTVHQPVLAITCKAQDQQFQGRKFDVAYTISDTGDAPAAGAVLSVPVPSGLTVDSVSNSGQVKDGNIVWDLGTVDVNAPQNVSATFISANSGEYQFAGTVKGTCAAPQSSSCGTKVVGIAAILLEKSDNPDPVAINDTTTYTVKVTNQGSADDSNVAITVEIAPELVPVSSDNPNAVIDGQKVTFPVIPTLGAKQAVTYTIVAKGVKAGDGHTKFILNSDILKSAISAEESTTVY